MSRASRNNPAKRFLQRIQYYDAQINSKIDEREAVKSMVLRVTTSMSLAPGGGGGGDRIGSGVGKLVDLERDINAAIDRFVDLRRKAADMIERLDNPDEVEVLQKRYIGIKEAETGWIKYLTYEEIAEEMHMSVRNVHYAHGRALQNVARMMEEKSNERD